MNKKMMAKNTAAFLVITLLLLPPIAAFGITPGKKIFTLEENGVAEGEVTVINTEGRTMTLTVSPQGELAPYITVSESLVTLKPDQSKTITYRLQAPPQFDRRGTYENAIIVKEVLPQSTGGKQNDIAVRAIGGVASIIEIHVPYEGKTIDALLYIAPTKPFKPVTFIAQVTNTGDQPIKRVELEVEIADQEGNPLTTVSSEEKRLEVKERIDLKATWNPDVEYGEYRANLILKYDGKKEEITTDLMVGRFPLEPQDIHIENFVFNQAATLVIMLKNIAEETSTATTEVSIADEKKDTISLGAQTREVLAQETLDLQYEWSLVNRQEGKYFGAVSIEAAGLKSERAFSIVLTEQGIEATFQTPDLITGKSITLTTSPTHIERKNIAVIVIIFIIMLINTLGLIIYLKKKQKKEGAQQS